MNPSSSLMSPALPQDRLGPSALEQEYYGLSLEAWVKISILVPLFAAVYWIVLRWLWDKTRPIYGEANWGHAIFIPLAGLWYLFVNREEMLAEPVKPLFINNFLNKWRLLPAAGMIVVGALLYLVGHDPNGLIKFGGAGLLLYGILVGAFDWGIGSMLMGLGAFVYGIYPGQNQFLQGCAMILTLFGIVLTLCGWRIMQWAWFPIIYLVCGIPWPPLVYSYIASPLQTFAAKVAVVTLRFTGVNAYRTGTKINMGGIAEPLRTLNVAEACAGLRSLMTFITVGMAVAFLSNRALWQKIVITLSAIPIAIFCNVMRISGQGLLDHYVPAPYGHQLAEGFAHQFVGLVMLVPAFFMILLVGWILDHIFVEEVDEDSGDRAAAAAAAAQAAALVVEIPRKSRVAPVPNVRKAAAPAPAKAQATGAAPPAKPAPSAAPPAAKPQAPVPPRPAGGAVPPRPGIIPPRPGIVPPRPGQPRPPKPGEGS